jgi:eukaryotic-like serine/threonine-protein kinase
MADDRDETQYFEPGKPAPTVPATVDPGATLAVDGVTPPRAESTRVDPGLADQTAAWEPASHAPVGDPTVGANSVRVTPQVGRILYKMALESDVVADAATVSVRLGPNGTAEYEVNPNAGRDADTVDVGPGVLTVTKDGQGPPTEPRGRTARVLPTLPGHEVLGELGRGGMGVVYKARHVKLDRLVAVKMVLAGAHAGPDELARFYIEAQAVARLNHKGVVQIHEVGEKDGLPFFSLEYLDGGSLAQKIAGKPQPPVQGAVMVEALALAMAVAHDEGIIHRDLKPANILLSKQGEPKITDFGLAKRLEGDSKQTRSGAIMGTPSYMSPEQAWGLSDEIGPLADQYSLGAILYEMLTGRPPFQGATALDTIDQVRTQEPVPPSRLQPKMPRDLETICLKVLQKESSRRYADCHALAADLRRFLNGEPILARPVAAPERVWRWCRRNPRVAALSAASLTLAATLLVGSITTAAVLNTKNTDLRNQTELAIKSAAKEKTAHDLADRRREEAVAAKAESDKLAVKAFQQNRVALDAFLSVSSYTYRNLRDRPGTQQIRQNLIHQVLDQLGKATKIIDELAAIRSDAVDPIIMGRTIGGAHQFAGQVAEELGQRQAALQEYQAADDVLGKLAQDHPESLDAQNSLAAIKMSLGMFQMRVLGDAIAARDQFQKVLELRRAGLARAPDNDDYKLAVANATGLIAGWWLELGDPFRAAELYREEEAVRASFGPITKRRVQTLREQASFLERRGDALLRTGKREAALDDYKASLAIRDRIVKAKPLFLEGIDDRIFSYAKEGEVNLLTFNDYSEAVVWYEKALKDSEELLARDKNSVRRKLMTATMHYYLATAFLRLKKHGDAATHYRACYEIRKTLANDMEARRDPAAKTLQIDLMVAAGRVGAHDEAASLADLILEDPPLDARIYFQVACGYALAAGAAKGDPKLVRTYTDKSLATLQKALTAGWNGAHDIAVDPDLDAIRNDPGFTQVIADFRRAGTAAEAAMKTRLDAEAKEQSPQPAQPTARSPRAG